MRRYIYYPTAKRPERATDERQLVCVSLFIVTEASHLVSLKSTVSSKAPSEQAGNELTLIR